MNWFKKNDIFLKLLSLLTALVVWMYVGGANNFQEEYKANGIRPEFIGLDDLRNSKNLVLVGDYFVDIELSGTYSALLSLDEDDIEVEVDLERVGITQPGTYEIPYTVELPSSDYSLLWKDPQKLKVTFDSEKTVSVDVKVFTDKLAAENFYIDREHVVFSPKKLLLSGLQADIEKISYVGVDTGKEHMKSTVSGEFPYKFYDADGKQLKNLSVEADYEFIDVSIPILATKDVRLTLEVQGNENLKKYINYTCSPETIKIAGNESQINVKTEQIVGTVNVSDLYPGYEREFTIIPPDGIINLSEDKTATVKVGLSDDLKSKTVSASLIELRNVNEGNKVKPLGANKEITIFGTSDSLKAVDSQNVRLIADLNSTVFSKGRHSVSAYVEIDGVSDVFVANPDDYSVNIEVK